MKHFFSSIFILTILLASFFSISNWYFSEMTRKMFETTVGQVFKSDKDDENLFQLDIINYKKTILGAKAKLQLNSNLPLINAIKNEKNEGLADIKLRARLLNGPLFITKKGIHSGSSRWLIDIDETALDKSQKEELYSIFSEQLPKLLIIIGMDQKARYSLDIQIPRSKIMLNGVYDIKNQSTKGTVKIGDFSVKLFSKHVTAEHLDINYQAEHFSLEANQSDLISFYFKDTALQIRDIPLKNQMMPTGTNSINLALSGKILNFSQYLNAGLTIRIRPPTTLPIVKGDMNITLKNVLSKAIPKYFKALAESENIQQQLRWTLEENGEFPEGQDQIWQLNQQIEENKTQLRTILFEQLLNSKTEFAFNASVYSDTGESKLNGSLSRITSLTKLLTQLQKKSIENRGGGLTTLFSVLQGEADVSLDDRLATSLKKSLRNFSLTNRSQFKLILKDNKLLMQ